MVLGIEYMGWQPLRFTTPFVICTRLITLDSSFTRIGQELYYSHVNILISFPTVPDLLKYNSFWGGNRTGDDTPRGNFKCLRTRTHRIYPLAEDCPRRRGEAPA